MSIITPTVGRVVLFRPGPNFTGVAPSDGSPLPALISRVWSDRMINIGGFDADGKPFSATSVPLIQGDEPEGQVLPQFYAEWMLYQKDQAAKIQVLEKQAAVEVIPSSSYVEQNEAHSVAYSAANQVPYSGDPESFASAVAIVYKNTKAEILRPGTAGKSTV